MLVPFALLEILLYTVIGCNIEYLYFVLFFFLLDDDKEAGKEEVMERLKEDEEQTNQQEEDKQDSGENDPGFTPQVCSISLFCSASEKVNLQC